MTVNLVVRVQGHEVQATVHNNGHGELGNVRLTAEMGDWQHAEPVAETLAAGSSQMVTFSVPTPEEQGSHALVVWARYLDGGKERSRLEAVYVDQGEPSHLKAPLRLGRSLLRLSGRIGLDHEVGQQVRLLLPDELELVGQNAVDAGTSYRIENRYPDVEQTHVVFAIAETEEGGQRSSRIVRSFVTTKRVAKASSVFTPRWLAILGLLGLVLAYVAFRRATRDGRQPDPGQVAFVRWGFSLFTVSLLFFLFHTAQVVPDWFFASFTINDLPDGPVGKFGWRILNAVLGRMYFEGGDYDYFANHVLDPLYIYVLVLNYPVLRWVVKPDPVKEKYWHLIRTTFSLPTLLTRRRELHWSPETKVAVLTLMVKIFYVPLLCSWAINDIVYQGELIRGFHWDFMTTQKFVVATLILIDVSVYAFGYLVELPQLDNQIRTVEPTLLGWVVCLACYPPFNSYAFAAFDYSLTDDYSPSYGFWRAFALSLIAILWAFYTWASVALGVRASNLTNRGVVKSGPYAYVRHPAYASKVLLWIVGAWFLGERHFWMCLGLAATYAARAWTEERHLSLDPDYLEYRKEVPYRFVPWVW